MGHVCGTVPVGIKTRAKTSHDPTGQIMEGYPVIHPTIGSLALVQLASAVPLAADFAVAGRLTIVHTMFYWPERS